MTLVAIYISITMEVLAGIMIMLVNIFMNLYPSLLQQKNKRRIDVVMLRQLKKA